MRLQLPAPPRNHNTRSDVGFKYIFVVPRAIKAPWFVTGPNVMHGPRRLWAYANPRTKIVAHYVTLHRVPLADDDKC